MIPARDEAATIADVVSRARAVVDEVIVVDDGSRDETSARARHAGAYVVRNHLGRGKGHALRTGVAAASGDVVVMLDADGQDDPHDIPRLLAVVDAGADLVVGTRFAAPVAPGAVKRLDHAGNRFLTAMLNRLYGVRLTDTQAGFRAVRRALWQRLPLRADGFDVETEVLIRAIRSGARVEEVAVGRYPREHGQRVLQPFRDGLTILGCMLRLRLES